MFFGAHFCVHLFRAQNIKVIDVQDEDVDLSGKDARPGWWPSYPRNKNCHFVSDVNIKKITGGSNESPGFC